MYRDVCTAGTAETLMYLMYIQQVQQKKLMFVIGEHYANEPHLSWDMYKDSGAAIEEQLKYEAEIEGGG